MDDPISQSSVSLRLAAIQKRCAELMEENDDLAELSLDESDDPSDSGGNDYFTRG